MPRCFVAALLHRTFSAYAENKLDISGDQCKNPRAHNEFFQLGKRRATGFISRRYSMSTPKSHLTFIAIILVLTIAVVMVGCNRSSETTVFTPDIQPLPQQLTTYEPMPIPADNPLTPEKVALGRELFFDERLSGDGSRSCYSCHVCEKGLTDGLPKAIGAFNKQLPRSSPTLWNIGYHKEFYWDGRSPSLEKQALAAWTGANMGAKVDEIAAKLNALQGYRGQFQKVFGGDATPDNIVKAIAAFERTIISGNTAWTGRKPASNQR